MKDVAIVTVEDLDGVTLKLKDGKVTAAPSVGMASEWGVAPVTVMASSVQTVPFKRRYTNIPTVIISLSDPATMRFVGLREVTTTGFSFSSNYAFTNQTLHYVVYSND